MSRALGDLDRVRLLHTIGDYWSVHGYAPAVRDLAGLLGLGLSATHNRIADAVERGLVATAPGVARSVRVTAAGALWLLGGQP